MNTTNLYNEKQLFEQVAEGSEIAFRELFRHYTLQLRPFILSIGGTELMVDEVIQETMIKVWLYRDKLDTIEHPRAWICRVAANVCYTHRKKILTGIRKVSGIETSDRHNDVIEQTDYNQLKAAVHEAIEQLSPKRREVYRLRREAGLTIPEIAAQLHLSGNTVRNTLAAAGEFIRESLKQKGYTSAMLLTALWAL